MTDQTTTVTLGADEAWLLYRLAAAESGRCLLDRPHREHAHPVGTVLRKLGEATAQLGPAPDEALPARLAQLLAAIRAEGGDWSPARAMNAYRRLGWDVTPQRGHANMKRLAELGFLEPVGPRSYTYRLITHPTPPSPSGSSPAPSRTSPMPASATPSPATTTPTTAGNPS